MGEDKNMSSYILKINVIVCGISCTGSILDEDEVVARVLKSLPPPYDNKVAAIEGIRTVTTVTREKLVRNLIVFELNALADAQPKNEKAFKAAVTQKNIQRSYQIDKPVRRIHGWERVLKEIKKKTETLKSLMQGLRKECSRDLLPQVSIKEKCYLIVFHEERWDTLHLDVLIEFLSASMNLILVKDVIMPLMIMVLLMEDLMKLTTMMRGLHFLPLRNMRIL